jgi:hypothetical protein
MVWSNSSLLFNISTDGEARVRLGLKRSGMKSKVTQVQIL